MGNNSARVQVTCPKCGASRWVAQKTTQNKAFTSLCGRCAHQKWEERKSADEDLVAVVCPTCGRERKLARATVEARGQSLECGVCRYEKLRARRGHKQSAEVNGCQIVEARSGRCERGDNCPGYWDCLSYAADNDWRGWKVCAGGEGR